MFVLLYKKGKIMGQQTMLSIWMDEKGYSKATLAKELGLGYNYIHKLTVGERPLANSFKFRFLQRFGIEEASKVFDVESPEPVTELA